MKKKLLKSKISEYVELSDTQWSDFNKILKESYFKPGDMFLKPGENCDLIGFIEDGVFRHYIIDDKGNEKTTDFCIKGEFTGSTDPFNLGVFNQYWIEALTQSTVITFNSQDLVQFLESNKSIGDILSKIMLPLLKQKSEREIDLLTKDATGRYESFLKRFPSLDREINQYYIASYIGVSPETLSRIKKRYHS